MFTDLNPQKVDMQNLSWQIVFEMLKDCEESLQDSLKKNNIERFKFLLFNDLRDLLTDNKRYENLKPAVTKFVNSLFENTQLQEEFKEQLQHFKTNDIEGHVTVSPDKFIDNLDNQNERKESVIKPDSNEDSSVNTFHNSEESESTFQEEVMDASIYKFFETELIGTTEVADGFVE